MEYDEDRELTRYVWNYFANLMTEFEQQVGRAILGRIQAANAAEAGSPVQAEMMLRSWGKLGVPEIEAALAAGPEAFRRQARDRLLSERKADVFVNRCARCTRVVQTPKARQCLWCGFDWHGAQIQPGAPDGGGRTGPYA